MRSKLKLSRSLEYISAFFKDEQVINTPVPVGLSLVFLLIRNLISRLRLHQFLGTKTTLVNKSLKTDANGAY